jgi:hypothetical protein
MAKDDEPVRVFFRALRVFRGESSSPIPFDQVGSVLGVGFLNEEEG